MLTFTFLCDILKRQNNNVTSAVFILQLFLATTSLFYVRYNRNPKRPTMFNIEGEYNAHSMLNMCFLLAQSAVTGPLSITCRTHHVNSFFLNICSDIFSQIVLTANSPNTVAWFVIRHRHSEVFSAGTFTKIQLLQPKEMLLFVGSTQPCLVQHTLLLRQNVYLHHQFELRVHTHEAS